MKDSLGCDVSSTQTFAAAALSQEFIDATYSERRWHAGASQLAVAIEHGRQYLAKMSPQEQGCFGAELIRQAWFDSDNSYALQASLIYIKENSHRISRSPELQISKEDLQNYAKHRSLSVPERILIDHTIRNFDRIRAGDQFDGNSYVPNLVLDLLGTNDNAANITQSDILKLQRNFGKYAALEG